MPGQTVWLGRWPRAAAPAFNGGPGNCPAKPSVTLPATGAVMILQWRAGQLPGQTARTAASAAPTGPTLQWRAGQLPGQTSRQRSTRPTGSVSFNGGPGNCPTKRPTVKVDDGCDSAPSMEGRAIARPNLLERIVHDADSKTLQWRAGQLPGQTLAFSYIRCYKITTFNGGPGNCPAKHGDPCGKRMEAMPPSMEGRAIARPNFAQIEAFVGRSRAPSMEGRAIARPNLAGRRSGPTTSHAFNGGPGNCPAKPSVAGDCRHGRHPSMEGRAIARPNISEWVSEPPMSSLQWRAGQLPGQTPELDNVLVAPPMSLQWRAGQLPGQTAGIAAPPARVEVPSMEGRAIARPNPGWDEKKHAAQVALQWRAGQLPGQTGRAGRRAHRADSPFNGGPGNCPAKHGVRGVPPVLLGPSMEGRAIARPNVHDGRL